VTEKIDISRFEELSDGDRDSLSELIQLYLSKSGEQLVELEHAISNKSAANTARIAHSMIGANAMVGIDSIVPTLRKLESQGENGEMEAARETFAELQTACKTIHASLREYLQTLPAS
jgi:HPt (histidine-containing phosphotransfer) domain-containing protein